MRGKRQTKRNPYYCAQYTTAEPRVRVDNKIYIYIYFPGIAIIIQKCITSYREITKQQTFTKIVFAHYYKVNILRMVVKKKKKKKTPRLI